MKKISLIIQREYLSRVKKKSFLVTTILVPILMFAAITGMVYVAINADEQQVIAVWDESGRFIQQLDSTDENYKLIYSSPKPGENRDSMMSRLDADILVHVQAHHSQIPDSVLIYKEGGVSLSAKSFISSAINDIHQDKLLEEAGIQQSKIDSIQSQKLPFRSIDLKNNQETNTEIASMIGYGMGLLIYLILFIYGAGVMRGVMEEKTNRIAEVIISSVRPFQLMMGKIIGIALVGLTQFLIWGVIMILLNFLLPLLFPDLQSLTPGNLSAMSAGAPNIQDFQNNESLHFIQTAMNQNWGLIIGAFLFYFLGGYFMYASMFAAVGSLVNEDMQDAQQMTIPISMPIFFAFIIMAATAENPNSPLAIFGSLFPLTSPIVMMARIPYGVPGWQLGLSTLFLVIGFIGMTWISGKIYRTGILMYGKKITGKEVFKWIQYH
ncbi:MAG TPA: ABC transporter permease [Chitinophagaceae bacterium]|nr:ABC transporter permease [Chitinophagaceae bacterium]